MTGLMCDDNDATTVMRHPYWGVLARVLDQHKKFSRQDIKLNIVDKENQQNIFSKICFI